MTDHTEPARLLTAVQHMTAAATRTRKAAEALNAAGKPVPAEAHALILDLETAAEVLSRLQQQQPALIIALFPDSGRVTGKLADAELHFQTGPLAGLKLIGFGIWERRTGGGRNVTFPARSYTVNGDRRSFALLRPTGQATHNPEQTIRLMILDAYQRYEEGTTAPLSYDQDGRFIDPRPAQAAPAAALDSPTTTRPDQDPPIVGPEIATRPDETVRQVLDQDAAARRDAANQQHRQETAADLQTTRSSYTPPAPVVAQARRFRF